MCRALIIIFYYNIMYFLTYGFFFIVNRITNKVFCIYLNKSLKCITRDKHAHYFLDWLLI